MDHVFDAAIAEALALQRGLQFLEQLGVSSVIVESDSLGLVQACNSEIEVWSPFSAILDDCFMRTHSFNSIGFQHCPREANKVAHHLEKVSFESNYVISWDGDPPGFIMPFAIHDVTILNA